MKTAVQTDTTAFKHKLATYKELIDDDIQSYSKQLQKTTLQDYGAYARLEVDAFLSILARGGKRIRGALTMLGYEMTGGKDQAMVLQAARSIEMIHAYILMIDDFQDRSPLRRGDKTAHMVLADYHRTHRLAGDAEHFGASIAWNAALTGNHQAQTILADLEVDPEKRLKVIDMVNKTMITTGHGQTYDLMNESVAEVHEANVERVMEWKTTVYTLLNPLQVGMVLAGAGDNTLKAVEPFASHAGKLFQIIDDIIGTFGTEAELGKSPVDDMREGKRTFLTVYALKHANTADKNFLIQTLGKANITPTEFERAKAILVECGAVDHTKKLAQEQAQAALKTLDKIATAWSAEGAQFLRGLTQYLLERHT